MTVCPRISTQATKVKSRRNAGDWDFEDGEVGTEAAPLFLKRQCDWTLDVTVDQ